MSLRSNSAINTAESPGPPRLTNPNQKKTTQVCSFFAKGQGCRFGNKCRYLHPVVESQHYPIHQQASFHHEAVKDTSSKPQPYIPPHRFRPNNRNHGAVKDEEDRELLPINQNTLGQVCKFFSRNGYCSYGDTCRYVHQREPQDGGGLGAEYDPISAERSSNGGNRGRGRRGGGPRFQRKPQLEEDDYSGVAEENQAREKQKQKKPKGPTRKPICRYFKSGKCRQGDRCKFRHPTSDLPEISDDEEHTEELGEGIEDLKLDDMGNPKTTNPLPGRRPVQPQTELALEALTDDDVAKHRISEINSLMKRFPRAEQTSLPRRTEEAYKIVFVPSDPDWVCRLMQPLFSIFLLICA